MFYKKIKLYYRYYTLLIVFFVLFCFVFIFLQTLAIIILLNHVLQTIPQLNTVPYSIFPFALIIDLYHNTDVIKDAFKILSIYTSVISFILKRYVKIVEAGTPFWF